MRNRPAGSGSCRIGTEERMPTKSMRPLRRRALRKGAELLEFTFALLPLLAMMFVLLDAAWGMYVKSTMMYAVRVGVRVGITITGTQATAAGKDLTTMVKDVVQSNAMGLLAGTAGRNK